MVRLLDYRGGVSAYDLRAVKLPTLSGRSLVLFARLLRAPVIGRLLLDKLVRDAGIPKLLEARLDLPPTPRPLAAAADHTPTGAPDAAAVENRSGMASVRDYQRAYGTGRTTPSQVADATLSAIERSNAGARPLRAIIACQSDDVRRQAEASTRRYQARTPLGPFDGVPVAIKDELDLLGYPTSVGTSFLGREPAREDATVVARLRAAGALLIGKANMYELGISPESHNMHHGVARNPHNPSHQSGGSSSGPATAVAAGLCPVAIGADGGGSIRVPAAFCGVVGLKATYGRVSEHGAAPLCWSVAHVGPIGQSVEDVALSYQLIAGPDARDPTTALQPAPELGQWTKPDLDGVRLGVFRPWFEHAEPEIVSSCQAMLEEFARAGARIQEIEVPALDLMRIAHAVTILSEMAAALQPYAAHFRRHAPAVQANLLAGREFQARHYVLAQQVRTLAMRTFAGLFARVDAVITPTTAVTAPAIPEASARIGWSDLSTVTEIMRFIVPGNLVGMPAISFPVGYGSASLPIGMQAMAKHWNEPLLLRIAHAAERVMQRRTPEVHYALLAT